MSKAQARRYTTIFDECRSTTILNEWNDALQSTCTLNDNHELRVNANQINLYLFAEALHVSIEILARGNQSIVFFLSDFCYFYAVIQRLGAYFYYQTSFLAKAVYFVNTQLLLISGFPPLVDSSPKTTLLGGSLESSQQDTEKN